MRPEAFSLSCAVAGQPLVVRFITPDDWPQVLALHHAVFGSSLAHDWCDWKYGADRGHAVGAWHEGRLIAMCGGLPRTLHQGGHTLRGLQICDVMVDAAWRGILTRRGPFFMVCHELYSRLLGPQKDYHIGFGFPSARHLRLAVKSGLSWQGEMVEELFWPSLPAPARHWPWSWRLDELTPAARTFKATIDQAWARMRQATATQGLLTGARDASYVQWRYTARPDMRYAFAALRPPWRHGPCGVLVVHLGQAAHEPLRWVDWIGPPDDLRHALAAARQWAHRLGHTGMSTWLSPTALAVLEGSGWTARSAAAQLGIPRASAMDGTAVDQQRWWLTAGDTDFL